MEKFSVAVIPLDPTQQQHQHREAEGAAGGVKPSSPSGVFTQALCPQVLNTSFPTENQWGKNSCRSTDTEGAHRAVHWPRHSPNTTGLPKLVQKIETLLWCRANRGRPCPGALTERRFGLEETTNPSNPTRHGQGHLLLPQVVPIPSSPALAPALPKPPVPTRCTEELPGLQERV